MQDQLSLVIVGHVDHGKSTLIGRLLHDAGALPEGKLAAIEQMCARRGMPFEWSFVMDALQTERDQGITLDTTQVWFAHANRRYVIIDAPGHREFLKNMMTGAASADAALLLIDAREGVREQTRRHAYLLHLLGLSQVAVVVNKMDVVGYGEAAFTALSAEITQYLASLGITPSAIIPISAREGDGVAVRSGNMPFYTGPTVLEVLTAFVSRTPEDKAPLRFSVQDVYKFDDRRIIAGRVESGALSVGDTLLFSPSSTSAKVAEILRWPQPGAPTARAGECIGITLDAPVFVERGQVASHAEVSPFITNIFRARIFWLGKAPLAAGKRYTLRHLTAEVSAEVRAVEAVINTDTLARSQSSAVEKGLVAEVVLRTRGSLALDAHAENPRTGRFVLVDGFDVAGGGIVDLSGFANQRVAAAESKSSHITPYSSDITPEKRAEKNGHTGGILWFTGLSGAGKTTIAQGLQNALFAKGYQVFVLDGDNVRKGLCRDLGFSPEDRTENLRRAGEVAALFAQSGFIVITSFISPTHADRLLARASAPEFFHSVYIKADVTTCEKRDAKGLYQKARSGEIKEFTGISAPYEEPLHPDVVVDTMARDAAACVAQLVRYVEAQFSNSAEAVPQAEYFKGSYI